MKLPYYYIFIIFLFIVNHGQSQSVESITELIKSKKSSKKVASLIELAEKYEDIQLDTSEMLYHKAYLTAKALNDNQLIIDCIKGYSFIKNLQGKFEEGLALSKESLSLAQQIDDPLLIARQFANLGNSYSYLARFDEAIDLYQKSLDVFMKLKDRQKMAQISNVIASTYNNMATSNKFDTIWTVKSLSYRLKALEYSSAIEDSLLICDILVGTSLGYCNAQKFEIAIRYASRALPIALIKGYTNFEAQIYNIFSMAYRGIGDRQKSLDNGLKSVKVFKQLNHVQGLVIALKELTLIYKDLGLYNKADESVNQAIRIAEENQMKYILDGLYLNKSELSGTMSNYKLAYEFYDKGIQLKDSLRGIEVTKTISELEKKYETAKKDKEIIELSNKQKINKWVIISLLTLIGFVSLFSWFIIKNWQFRAKIAEQEKEQIKKEHKIEATSSIIKGQEEERTRMARDLHDGLGGILSGLKYSLNNMEENIILNGENVTQFHQAIEQIDHAITEMRRVAHNMMPESLIRFGLDDSLKDFALRNSTYDFTIHYRSYNYVKLDQSVEVNLYRIIQEAINNTLKHAKAHDVYLQLDYTATLVTLTIEDNGQGFDISKASNGIGLDNIKNRVAYLNGNIDISSAQGKGTLIVIEIEI